MDNFDKNTVKLGYSDGSNPRTYHIFIKSKSDNWDNLCHAKLRTTNFIENKDYLDIEASQMCSRCTLNRYSIFQYKSSIISPRISNIQQITDFLKFVKEKPEVYVGYIEAKRAEFHDKEDELLFIQQSETEDKYYDKVLQKQLEDEYLNSLNQRHKKGYSVRDIGGGTKRVSFDQGLPLDQFMAFLSDSQKPIHEKRPKRKNVCQYCKINTPDATLRIFDDKKLELCYHCWLIEIQTIHPMSGFSNCDQCTNDANFLCEVEGEYHYLCTHHMKVHKCTEFTDDNIVIRVDSDLFEEEGVDVYIMNYNFNESHFRILDDIEKVDKEPEIFDKYLFFKRMVERSRFYLSRIEEDAFNSDLYYSALMKSQFYISLLISYQNMLMIELNKILKNSMMISNQHSAMVNYIIDLNRIICGICKSCDICQRTRETLNVK